MVYIFLYSFFSQSFHVITLKFALLVNTGKKFKAIKQSLVKIVNMITIPGHEYAHNVSVNLCLANYCSMPQQLALQEFQSQNSFANSPDIC